MESSTSSTLLVAAPHMPPPSPSITASAAPIVVPRLSEHLTDSTASSPAITTSAANGLAPPSVSPMAPSIHVPSSEATNSVAMMPQAVKAKPVTTKSQAGMNGGRWTEQEHQSFLAGLRLYGREWKKVASKIKTRTSAQIRSHAQKYFAKLARDDETRKLGSVNGANGLPSHMMGPDGAASLYGYMSDDGSSTTAGNLSGDDGADETDSNASQHQQQQRSSTSSATTAPLNTPSHRTILPIHPFPSPILGQPAAGLSINALFHGRGGAPLVVSAPGNGSKKRSRPSGASAHDLSPPHSLSSSCFKQHKSTASDVVSPHRLPSPEELVETVSPTVRQRLSSLIEAEISALQVLSCITWLQQQHQQGELKVQLQAPPPSASSVTSSGVSRHGSTASSSPASSASSSVIFPASSLAMFAAERSPSIF